MDTILAVMRGNGCVGKGEKREHDGALTDDLWAYS